MQVAKDLLEFLNDADIYVGFEFYNMFGDPTHLHGLRVLILKWCFSFKV